MMTSAPRRRSMPKIRVSIASDALRVMAMSWTREGLPDGLSRERTAIRPPESEDSRARDLSGLVVAARARIPSIHDRDRQARGGRGAGDAARPGRWHRAGP